MRPKKTKVTSIFAVLLIYVVMAGNTSGQLALCIGANGHVALEPLIHEHCHDHAHIEQNEPSSMGHEHDEHFESHHCKPCIDIPIFMGPTENRLPLKPVKPNSDKLICIQEPASISDYQITLPDIPHRFELASDENRFLRSIILLV